MPFIVANNKKKNSGFTIVEILVSLAISSVLLAGFIKVFASNQISSRMMNSFGMQQDNARVAHYLLGKGLRQAGHFGGVDLDEVTVHSSLALTGVGSCDQAWITDVTSPIRGYDGTDDISTVAGFPAGCVSAASYLKNSDILVVRYASSVDMKPVGSLENDEVYIRTIVGGNTLSGAEIFKGADGPSIGDATDPFGTYNYRYVTELYYVKSCSIESDTGCENELPALVRYQLNGTTFTEHVLVEGVEQFQLEFGIDSDSDYTADSYVSPSAVSNWKQVISAKFSLVIRGSVKDPNLVDGNVYSLFGDVEYTPSAEDKKYQRRVYSKVVQLRNMNRG